MVIAPGSRSGQLLLFLALLFGIATMHTMGHPSSSHGMPPAPVAVAAGEAVGTPHHGAREAAAEAAPRERAAPVQAAHPQAPHPSTRLPAGHHPVTEAAGVRVAGVRAAGVRAAGVRAAPGGAHAERAAPGPDRHRAAAHGESTATASLGPSGPRHGSMDPALVCLAVLGAWGVAVLAVAAGWFGRWAGPARLLTGTRREIPWAGAPPPRIRLARLSVLRI
ncbi:hypothetical protein ACFYT4_29080 [Streptomyces sp. NPDC004609]|uniref:hypothetical protein n=1 Tax=Streptomyces sp. NPDC004609 TaxID=3364704 RepID=UPI00369DDFE5